MSRVLTLIMILLLVIAHGSSVAAAVCRHEGGGAHAAALQSSDGMISAIAYSEEAAENMGSKKSPPADASSVSSPSDMLPALQLRASFHAREQAERNPADEPELTSATIRPLLEPPSA